MYPVKASTALDVLFFAHDANGDAVTGLTDGTFTKRISKAAAAFAAMTVTITERENGWYHCQLSTSHTDTLGILSVTFTNAGCKQINLQFRVHARLPDDLCFPTVSGRGLDITATGEGEAHIVAFNAGTITSAAFAAGAIDAAAIAADAIGASELAADAVAEIADAVWDEAKAGHVGAGSFGEEVQAHALSSEVSAVQADTDDIQTRLPAALVGGRMDSSVGAIAAGVDLSATMKASVNAEVDSALDTAIPGVPTANSINERVKAIDDKLPAGNISDVTTAQVNTEVDTALADVNLDHLVGTATGIPAVVAGTYLDQIMNDGVASFDRTTDSLQAIRDAMAQAVKLRKNVAVNNFEFLVVDSADHITPKTGLTYGAGDAQVSKDGGAFANLTNLPAEVSAGVYKINLAAADLNADTLMLKFSKTGADTRYIFIVTQP